MGFFSRRTDSEDEGDPTDVVRGGDDADLDGDQLDDADVDVDLDLDDDLS